MSQYPGQMPIRHSQYEPFRWMFWIRMAQIGVIVLLIALNAYSTSKLSVLGLWGLGTTWWSLVWTAIYIPGVTWGIPRIPANYRPNIIVLVLECFTWIWWGLAFIGLAVASAYIDMVYTALDGLTKFKRSTTVSPGSTSTGSSSSVYSTSTGSYSSGSSTSSDDNYGYWPGFDTISGVTKAVTAFAAIEWALFVATFIAICIRIHRQRKQRLQEIYQANGNPNVTINNIHMHGTPMSTDKQAEVHISNVS